MVFRGDQGRIVNNENADTAVILVHGLWMRGIALFALRRRLARSTGLSLHTFSYPSISHGLDANSMALSRYVSSLPSQSIHLVGHSLGGLIILNLLEQNPDPRIGRAILLGSPCAGSYCAAKLLRTSGLSMLVGRSIADSQRKAHWQTPVTVEIGVIAGNRSLGLGRIVPGLPRPNDGVVTVEETRLAQSRDHITLPIGHSEMLISAPCAAQVAHFLMSGHFSHD